MYLIDSNTFKLEQFVSWEDVDEYAILSHRWGAVKDEVLFEDMDNLSAFKKESGMKEAGMKKLEECCRIAREHDIRWVWMDTCCVDKKSSAELSESMNSMFNYYKHAKLCIAYLRDVKAETVYEPLFHSEFRKSEWFTRSWTLQELIAPGPEALTFYNHAWKKLAKKDHLIDFISEITGIDDEALIGEDISQFSIAERMAWAAHRKATRQEDVAYSLMGIFSVNMPMLYGEGAKAFQRLQEEILRHSDDETIFAWSYGPSP